MNEILNVERLEADRLKAIQEQRSDAANAFYSGAALGKGVLYGAWGLVKSVAEFSDLINPFDALSNAAVSAWNADVSPGGSWLDSFLEQYSAAQRRELAEALGFDPATISREKMAHAYEIASYVFQDNESQLALGHFAREYVKIQPLSKGLVERGSTRRIMRMESSSNIEARVNLMALLSDQTSNTINSRTVETASSVLVVLTFGTQHLMRFQNNE
ncbi:MULTISPECIES: hypothetical protein [Pseudomonas syringae group]|uniref:Uncharacterized protein n=2 Tax=Pseudomonas syringae group TaxID=136849 RepID=A0A3M2WJE7_PSEA0|nr:hypothetical protein [Pseudomonas amygdali]EGH07967.1 hypothetical protein PSYMP_05009 [Pseudomonas amygdali pv. morsprunorum str. M302280]RML50828.1 hypothetical protein ALQ94_00439 [Pseudomonas amygdali pv. morsprunorum]SOS36380.1 hypothetical protein CFBP6411_05023 [Pseudomonas syringae group genomosp. 3]SPF20551.1 hypothetical protein PSCFBP3800_05100 [Pseudomonas syringae group genomosp. 3]